METIYDPKNTALLCVDLYNDFISEGGKLYPSVKEIALELHMHENLRSIVNAARDKGIMVFHVPHHRFEPGDLDNWQYATPYQLSAQEKLVFQKDTWGGTFHDDFLCFLVMCSPLNIGDRVGFLARTWNIN